jgi:hypothetical protein
MYGLGGFEILSLGSNDGESWDTEQAQQFLEQHHAGMDLQRIVSADVASEQQTLLKATQAIFDLQQLQDECLAATCRLPSVYYEGFIGSCLALPVDERLRDSVSIESAT